MNNVNILPNTYLKRFNFICIYFTNVVLVCIYIYTIYKVYIYNSVNLFFFFMVLCCFFLGIFLVNNCLNVILQFFSQLP